ncbi:fatty acid desaturase family protein [Planctomycetes bacterium K23_9]|uniref:Fatty acid desaturase n=1 Tax=Stieleria marina TaxID=1930275 RepID=A0A517P2W8_9BACT|nr:Fatty acid desaturase [Planctomycetes bacterium K23_9]
MSTIIEKSLRQAPAASSDRKASSEKTSAFSFSQARTLIGDLNRPNAKIYWFDFLTSVSVAHLCAAALIDGVRRAFDAGGLPNSPLAIAGGVFCCGIAVILYMRAAMFIHELVHLPKEGFGAFRIAYNALFGCLFLVPSFLYYPHVDHHRRKHYGTKHDGEYLPLSHTSRWVIVGFIVQALIIPFLAIARFLIISPLCWLFPGARPYVHRHASTMLVDPSYERTDASPRVMRMVILQEAGCFVVTFLLVFGHRIFLGEWFDPAWIAIYAISLGVLTLNGVRTLGAHRWTHEGEEMSFQDQLLDSVNYPHCPWISELWGPTGTRYHALHHLFPRLPYHNLAKAHRRLVEGLPDDSPYHQTIAPSLTSEIIALWNRAGRRVVDAVSAAKPG